MPDFFFTRVIQRFPSTLQPTKLLQTTRARNGSSKSAFDLRCLALLSRSACVNRLRLKPLSTRYSCRPKLSDSRVESKRSIKLYWLV